LNSFGFLILLHELIADQAKGRQALPAGLHHAGATHAMALAVRAQHLLDQLKDYKRLIIIYLNIK